MSHDIDHLPTGLREPLEEYFQWLELRDYSETTEHLYGWQATEFATVAADEGCEEWRDVDHRTVRTYVLTLRERDVSHKSISSYLSFMRVFGRWLRRNQYGHCDAMINARRPKYAQKLPHFLTHEEVMTVLEAVDISTPIGVRDRTILEVLYASGLRRAELCGLSLQDFDEGERTLFVRKGKGGRPRTVCIGKPATEWVRRYMDGARGHLLAEDPHGKLTVVRYHQVTALFVTSTGRRIHGKAVYELVKTAAERVGLQATPHTLRHSFATACYAGGMNARQLQEQLGHEHVTTTLGYTHLVPEQIRRGYQDAHPRDRINVRKRRGIDSGSN